MIIGDSIAPIETIALPEPYQRSLGSIPSEGWESVLKIAESGRVWRLEFGADARPQTRPTGLELRRELEFDDFDPIDFAADRLVLEFDEHLHVFDVSTGRVRLQVSVRDGGSASCLTPDGRHLLRFNEDETKIWTFAEEPPPSRTTRLFHEGSEPLPLFGYEPQSARCVCRPGSGGGFHVVVGHLGFAVAYSLHPGDFAQPELRLDKPRRIHQGFICDPVTTIIGSRHPFVAVNEGYGCGLQLIDVETGDSRSCPEVVTSRLGLLQIPSSDAVRRAGQDAREDDRRLVPMGFGDRRRHSLLLAGLGAASCRPGAPVGDQRWRPGVVALLPVGSPRRCPILRRRCGPSLPATAKQPD